MNLERLVLVLRAVESQISATGVHDVCFYHDADCPCRWGGLPLKSCRCDPWVEIAGQVYRVNETGNLVPQKLG